MIYRPKKPNSKRQYIACRMVFIGKYNFLYMKEYFLSSNISVLKWTTIFSLSFCISICITALIASYSTLVVPVFLPDGTCSCEKCILNSVTCELQLGSWDILCRGLLHFEKSTNINKFFLEKYMYLIMIFNYDLIKVCLLKYFIYSYIFALPAYSHNQPHNFLIVFFFMSF